MARDLPAPATSASQQRRLLQIWLSPSFPVGAYAYSHGLERAVEAGFVTSRATLRGWIGDLFTHGSIRNDLILVAAAWQAVAHADWEDLGGIAELAAATQPSAERRLESLTQGGSFLLAVDAAWPATPHPNPPPQGGRGSSARVETDVPQATLESPPPLRGRARVGGGDTGGVCTYPIAVATAAAAHGIALDAVLEAYATAFTGNLASAAIRLSVIGQTDAQRLQADLAAVIDQATAFAFTSTSADLGSATFSADLCSMEHETQYTRLFRT